MSYLFRSMLYVPSYNEKYISKAIESEADAIIFDFEDACPPEKEEEGRSLVRRYLAGGRLKDRQVLMRVNELGTESLKKDLELLSCPGVLGIMPPKVSTPEEMREFDRLVTEKECEYGLTPGSLKFTPLVETAGAVIRLEAITEASDRIIALTFGGEDFIDSTWGAQAAHSAAFAAPRAMIVMVARAHDILPIDTPYLDIKNEEGFRKEESISAAMGFAGDLLVNPRQIPWANDVFAPSLEEIQHARRVVAAFEEAKKNGGTIGVLDGIMIGPPLRKRAEKVVQLAELIEKHTEKTI